MEKWEQNLKGEEVCKYELSSKPEQQNLVKRSAPLRYCACEQLLQDDGTSMRGFMQRLISVFSLHLCEQQTTQLINTCLASTINLCPYHSEYWCHQQHDIIHNKTILSVAIIILNDITIRVGKYPLHTARTPLTKCTKSLSDHPQRPPCL